MASSSISAEASHSPAPSSATLFAPSADHNALVLAVSHHQNLMMVARTALDAHLDEFVPNSAAAEIKTAREEKTAHLLASYERHEANYRRTKAMEQDSLRSQLELLSAFQPKSHFSPAPSSTAATSGTNSTFAALQKACADDLRHTFDSSSPTAVRDWHHNDQRIVAQCGLGLTSDLKLRLMYGSCVHEFDAARLKGFHLWPWDKCVNLIPKVLGAGSSPIQAAKELRDIRLYPGIADTSMAQETERFDECRLLVTGTRAHDKFAVQLVLLALPEPLRKEVLTLFDHAAHANRAATANSAVQRFLANIGRSDYVPEVPTAEFIQAVTDYFTDDHYTPDLDQTKAIIASVLSRLSAQEVRQLCYPTPALLAAAEQAFVPIARNYYNNKVWMPSKQVVYHSEQHQQPATYRAVVTSGATAGSLTTKPPATAADMTTSSSTELPPRSKEQGPNALCYVHHRDKHINAHCMSPKNMHGIHFGVQQTMLPPVAATAPASAAASSPQPPANANTRTAGPAPRTYNPSHGNSLHAIHHDELTPPRP